MLIRHIFLLPRINAQQQRSDAKEKQPMKMHRMMIVAAMALLPLAAGAATFIVPAAGTGAGANNSQWQTELTLHSTSNAVMNLQLTFHDRNGAAQTTAVALA